MTKTVKANMYWMTEGEGGRKTIPDSDKYSTVACFEDIKGKYSDEAWSVVIDLKNADKDGRNVTAQIRFLVEWAPNELLCSGSKFELFEGKKLVEKGEIL